MKIVHPYVYKPTHKETGEYYFGYRMGNEVPSNLDLGIKYKSSSKGIKDIGFENFNYEVIAEFIDIDHKRAGADAYCFEQITIKKHFDDPLCINKHYVDIESGKKHFRFVKHSQKSKDKISSSKRGIPRSEDTIRKMSESQKGRRLPEDIKEQMRLSRQSQEYKDKQSKSHTGKKHTKETKTKMAQASSGKTHSAETKLKISSGNKGRKHSEKTKEKLRGPKSEEHKQKMKDAWARRKAAVANKIP